jgi:transcription-repair coupling factor (superfamily II helicase)
VDFFGDVVDTIREFDVTSQRTVGRLEQVDVLPKREVPITEDTLEQYLERLPEEDADYIRRRYLNDPELPGLEWLSVMFGMARGSLLDYLPADAIIVTLGQGSLRAEAAAILAEAAALRERLKNRIADLPAPDEYYTPPEQLFERLAAYSSIDRVPFKGGRAGVIAFDCQPHPSFGSRLDLLADQLREYDTAGMTYFIATDNGAQAGRLQELITEKTSLEFAPPVEVANLTGGFVCPQIGAEHSFPTRRSSDLADRRGDSHRP